MELHEFALKQQAGCAIARHRQREGEAPAEPKTAHENAALCAAHEPAISRAIAARQEPCPPAGLLFLFTRGWMFLPVALALACLSGCVALEGFTVKGEMPPTGPVCHIVATWNRDVAFAPDPLHGGRPTPGLTGRLYLFGREIKESLIGDGSLVVELDVLETPAPGARPTCKLLERWEIDKVSLRKLVQKDPIGWGYTLFLPWATYRPEITQVKLRVCYQPPGAMPLYTESQKTLTPGKAQ